MNSENCVIVFLLIIVGIFDNRAFSGNSNKTNAETKRSSNPCSLPVHSVNGSRFETEQVIEDYNNGEASVAEVKFFGEIGPLRDKRLCKIKCVNGHWVGPLCVDKKDGDRFQPLFRNCRLEYFNPLLMVSYENIWIDGTQPEWIFPHGAKLQIRCKELGLHKLLGESAIACINGAWSAKLPSCIPTTLLTNFSEDSPPTVLVRVPSGSGYPEPNGTLAVYPGSNVHMECLFARRFGTPEWTWTGTFRQYTTGWSIAETEREWKYRLSVFDAKIHDSGTFTCATPRGITNSISLHVIAVHCESLDANEDENLISIIDGTRLGHVARFKCPVGYRLIGEPNITCQASGKWSSVVPACAAIECPLLELLDAHLHLVEFNTSAGGRAFFRCTWGYRLSGPPGLECRLDGKWSGDVPTCIAIQCPAPLIPVNGRLMEQTNGPIADTGNRNNTIINEDDLYSVGFLVQFTCNPGHRLIGEYSIVCTETGFWSHPPPFCTSEDEEETNSTNEKFSDDIMYY